jgi:hypothetical protein
MKTKLISFLFALSLAGCQQKIDVPVKSEIDKCVDAIVKASDSKTDPLGILPESKNAKPQAVIEAQARLDCLRAQAGK